MLCNSCRRAILSRSRSVPPTIIRTVATAPATSNAAPANPPPSLDRGTPATSSATPGISQPLSTPFFPSTSTAKSGSASGVKESKKSKIQSSVAGGTELKGLAYLKTKPQVLAAEDDEYPAWLWSLLASENKSDGPSSIDLAALTKKQRAKYDRKQERLMRDIPRPIPIHEQSRDLTQHDDDAITSLDKRQELTKSSRDARRKNIRETNFLKGM